MEAMSCHFIADLLSNLTRLHELLGKNTNQNPGRIKPLKSLIVSRTFQNKK